MPTEDTKTAKEWLPSIYAEQRDEVSAPARSVGEVSGPVSVSNLIAG